MAENEKTQAAAEVAAENTAPAKKKGGLNIPNALSLIRVLLVPAFLAAAIFLADFGIWGKLVPAALFGIAALTDLLDGKIARKYGLVTNFGKFLDPLADKFMVFGALLAILVTDSDPLLVDVFVWVSAIVIFRELAVTSMRLVVSGSTGKVIAASFWGKLKTCTQIVAILVIFLEPLVTGFGIAFFDYRIASYIVMAVMTFTTVASGIDYMRTYWPLIDTNK